MSGSCLDEIERKATRGVKPNELREFNAVAGVFSFCGFEVFTAPIYWCLIGGCCCGFCYSGTPGPVVSGESPTVSQKRDAGVDTLGRVCSGLCAIVPFGGPCVSQSIHEGACCTFCYRRAPSPQGSYETVPPAQEMV